MNVAGARLYDFNRGELQVWQANEKCTRAFCGAAASREHSSHVEECSLYEYLF